MNDTTSPTFASTTTDRSPEPADSAAVIPDIPQANIVSAQKGLKLAAIATMAFGLAFAIASTAQTDGLAAWFLDLVFLQPGDGPELTEYNHLSDAILGGVMVGWGAMIWLLADRILPRLPVETKHIVYTSAAIWFVTDSAGSIASGGWVNALLNAGYALMFVVPLRKI